MNPVVSNTDGVILDSPVWSADGVELGRVEEVHTHGFKVDAHLRPDYWLSGADIQKITPHGVVMCFISLDLAYHEIDDVTDLYERYAGPHP